MLYYVQLHEKERAVGKEGGLSLTPSADSSDCAAKVPTALRSG